MNTLYILYGFIAGFSLWPVWRLFNPWRCKCGKVHWSAHKMLEHVEMRHSHEVSKI